MRGTVMEVGKSGPIAEEKCHAYFVDMLLGVEYRELQTNKQLCTIIVVFFSTLSKYYPSRH